MLQTASANVFIAKEITKKGIPGPDYTSGPVQFR
jgi:hypothetical protein